jgi:hypothetical protein
MGLLVERHPRCCASMTMDALSRPLPLARASGEGLGSQDRQPERVCLFKIDHFSFQPFRMRGRQLSFSFLQIASKALLVSGLARQTGGAMAARVKLVNCKEHFNGQREPARYDPLLSE